MLAAANTYVEAGRHPVAAANLLLLGFTGNLLAWWERLPDAVKSSIQYSHKIGPDGNLLLNSFGQPIPNPVESLLATIRLHFGGLSDDTISKHTEILLNLRIRRVEDDPWYKNTFFARIYKIPDPFSIVLKDQFLAGLPKGFSQLVRENLSGSLESLPYGCLFSAVV